MRLLETCRSFPRNLPSSKTKRYGDRAQLKKVSVRGSLVARDVLCSALRDPSELGQFFPALTIINPQFEDKTRSKKKKPTSNVVVHTPSIRDQRTNLSKNEKNEGRKHRGQSPLPSDMLNTRSALDFVRILFAGRLALQSSASDEELHIVVRLQP